MPLGMSEEPAEKRRRFEGSPRNQPSEQSLAHAPGIFDSLPSSVLQRCFCFLGPCHFRFVAGTSRHFKEIYSFKHDSKTTWESAASSVACAELCVDDFKKNGDSESECLKEIVTQGAVGIGNIKVLEWARIKGFEFKSEYFLESAHLGHLGVLQWAQEKNLEWHSYLTLFQAAAGGHTHVADWIHDSGREMLGAKEAAEMAAFRGDVSMPMWLKEHNLLEACSVSKLHTLSSSLGRVNVLDWLHHNGDAPPSLAIFKGSALGAEHETSLSWALVHGVVLEEKACEYSAVHGNLPMLQWLRKNECPWSAKVIEVAEGHGKAEVAEWAIANGCPLIARLNSP